MLFNSIEFVVFLPIVFLLYWFLFNKKLIWQNGLLLVASYVFYGWWSRYFLGLLILSTVLDYSYGFGVASTNRKKAKLFLWLSIINNLGILGVFKYYNFFIDQFKAGFGLLGIHIHPAILAIALPVGISFYTFHGLSYVFDIYRGKQKPVRNYIDYAVFVSFFPLLVAGPIERAHHLLPQIQKKRFFNYSQAVLGCRLILWGLFKKVVIADNLDKIVSKYFIYYTHHNGMTLIFVLVTFSFQIYCDFSGYSDIAIGTAKLFGIELLSNFRFPYFSRDIAEFWRRWHISLSSWFRDYLYIPLGGSKNGKTKAVVNTFIIFIVSGFWHGASWHYIAWGFIHACGFLPLLLLNRNRKHITDVVATHKKWPSLKDLFQILMTYAFVTFAWLFFIAGSVRDALNYIKQIVSSIYHEPSQLLHLPECYSAFYYIIPVIICDWWLRRDERELRVPKSKILTTIIYLVIIQLIVISFLSNIGENNSFIYFQF